MEKAKNILFGSLARERLLEGMKAAYLNEEVEDPLLEYGVSFIKKASLHMNETCGRGEVLATFFLYRLTEEAFKYISLGHNPIVLKKGLEKATFLLLSHLKNRAQPLKNKEDFYHFAKTFIKDGDLLLQTIVDAFEKSSQDQIIVVKKDSSSKPYLELVHGFYLESGLISPYFVTNNDDMSLELLDAKILVREKPITSSLEILQELKTAPLLLIAPGIEGEALSSLIANKLKQNSPLCPIKASEKIIPLKKAKKVYADMNSTIIFEGEKDLICIIHTNHSKKLLTKNITSLKSALKDGVFSDVESELIASLKEIDNSQFSPAEKPVHAILEKALASPLKTILQEIKKCRNSEINDQDFNQDLASADAASATLFNQKKYTTSFHVISEALTTAVSITSTLLLSEALIMESHK